MKRTRSQLHELITDLSGQYRAAEENKRLTSAKLSEQGRLADLARQADEKADANLIEVRDKIEDAKREYAAAVDDMLGVPHADESPDAPRAIVDDLDASPNPAQEGAERARIFDAVFERPDIAPIGPSDEVARWAERVMNPQSASITGRSDATLWNGGEPGPNNFPNFGHPLQNGADDSGVTKAFNEATHP